MSDRASGISYFGFISYSRKDLRAAAWLQRRLEWFRFPIAQVPEDRRPPHPQYIRPLYRDRTNLRVSKEHYWEDIKLALEHSRFLIVLCSPHSAKSEAVEKEVAHFLAAHSEDSSRVIPVVLSGRLSANDETAALCRSLQNLGDSLLGRHLPTMVAEDGVNEQDGWEQGFVELVSYMLSVDRSSLGDHIQREARKQATALRRRLAFTAALAVAAVIGLVVAVIQKQRADIRSLEVAHTRATADNLVSNIIDELGSKLSETGESSVLTPATEMALTYFKNLPSTLRDENTRRNTADCLFALSGQLSGDDAGRKKDALRFAAESVRLYEELVVENPNHQQLQEKLLEAFIAWTALLVGDEEEAATRSTHYVKLETKAQDLLERWPDSARLGLLRLVAGNVRILVETLNENLTGLKQPLLDLRKHARTLRERFPEDRDIRQVEGEVCGYLATMLGAEKS